jgi:ABC-type Na+ transport system ATPase subunit NatA
VNDTTGPVILAEGVRKTYPSRNRPSLDGFDLVVRPGTVHALLGPNGAGKTTAVRAMSTLVRFDEGRVRVAGHDVVSQSRRVRECIGLTGQYAALDEVLSGRRNLEMFARLHHLRPREAKARAAELLERFGLTDAAERPVRHYSGGMRRRLDLAASLILDPQVLFLDEPTTGLDPRSRAEVWRAVRDLVDRETFDLLNSIRVEQGLNPLPDSTFNNYTRHRAVESQAHWYLWAEFLPHYMIDLHHQGTYYSDDSDDMTTFSMGISLDPGMLEDSQWDAVRQMAVVAADAADRHGAVNVTRYPYINIPEGVTSAAMLNAPGPDGEYAGWRTNAMFFESRGGIGQKSRGYLVNQNVVGLRAITEAIADGTLADVDPDRWDDIPPRGAPITQCTKFPQQCAY